MILGDLAEDALVGARRAREGEGRAGKLIHPTNPPRRNPLLKRNWTDCDETRLAPRVTFGRFWAAAVVLME